MMWGVLSLSLAIWLMAGHGGAAAQRGGDPAWSVFAHELSANDVRAVLVDRQGNLWFGSRGGLDYFDGRWRNYGPETDPVVGPVQAIAQTPDGVVWIGGRDGLARGEFEGPDQTLVISGLDAPVGPVYALWVASNGDLWVGAESSSGYLSNGEWHPVLESQEGHPSERVFAIAGDSQGRVWLGGDSLYAYDLATGQLSRLQSWPSNATVQTLLVGPPTGPWSETLWVGTKGDGLLAYTQGQWYHFWRPPDIEFSEGIAHNDVLSLIIDDDETLWIGTNGGGISLFSRDGLNSLWGGGTWRTLTALDGLSADAVADIAIDADGAAWIGTIGGVTRFDAQSWRTLSGPELPAGVEVVTALRDSTGALWFGTEGYGLIHYDGRSTRRLTQEEHGLPSNNVRSLLEDNAGSLWVGFAGEELVKAQLVSRADLNAVQPADWQAVAQDALGPAVARASLRARDGSLWFGLQNRLTRYRPGENEQTGAWQLLTTLDGEISQNALLEDSSGRIWVGTSAGLSRYDPATRTWRTFTAADGLGHDQVLSLVEIPTDTGGNVLYAGMQEGGIARYDAEAERWQPFASLTTPVYALLAGPTQTLWAGTANGLRRYDLERGLERLYGAADGLAGNEVRTLTAGEATDVWIGTRLGISRHWPHKGRPQVAIEAVNGKQPIAGRVQVLAGEPVVISYRGSDLLTPPDEMLYRVRLSGEDGWRLVNERQTTYTSLQPGDFTFEVESVDTALNLSETPAVVVVEAIPTVVLPLLGRMSYGSAYSLAAATVLMVGASAGLIALTSRTRRRRREAVKRRFNPYVSGEPVRESDMFFGRDEVIAKIMNTLHENSIMIHGERRIGKTSLLHQLEQQLRTANDPQYLFVPVYVDLEGTSEQQLFYVIMEEIARVLPHYLSAEPPLRFGPAASQGYDDRAFGRDLSDVLQALAATTQKRVRLILLLDEMDVMNTYDPLVQQQMRRLFMRTFARNLGAVVAGIQISKEWDRVESPWYNLFNEIELGPLDDEAARRLILDPVKGIYSYDPAAVDFIIEASQGRPFYVQQHCLEAVNYMLTQGRRRVTHEDAMHALGLLAEARKSQVSGLSVGLKTDEPGADQRHPTSQPTPDATPDAGLNGHQAGQ